MTDYVATEHEKRHRRRLAVLRGNWRGFPLVPKPRPGATLVGVWAWGGVTRVHDYLLSDGSIIALREDEAADQYLVTLSNLQKPPGQPD